MSILYLVDPVQRLGISLMPPEVGVHDVTAHANALVDHPEWSPGFREIVDFQNVVAVDLPPEEFKQTLSNRKRLGERLGSGRIAVLTVTKVFPLVKLAATHIGRDPEYPREFRIFQNRQACSDWLAVDPSIFERVRSEGTTWPPTKSDSSS